MVVKKEKKSHSKLGRLSSTNSETLCPLSFPSLATLIRPAVAEKMTYCQGCDGSWDSGELFTPEPRIHKVQKDQTPHPGLQVLQGFNALTTTEENQNCFSCRQRVDESLFFFQWQLCNIALFCTYCERRFYICVVCCGSGPEPGGFAPEVQNY